MPVAAFASAASSQAFEARRGRVGWASVQRHRLALERDLGEAVEVLERQRLEPDDPTVEGDWPHPVRRSGIEARSELGRGHPDDASRPEAYVRRQPAHGILATRARMPCTPRRIGHHNEVRRRAAPTPEARIAELERELAQAAAELHQRNAELAVVNEIGAALAKQLDFEAIIELVGERLAATLRSTNMFIGLFDRLTNLITFPFELAAGQRVHGEPIRLGEGLTSRMLQSGGSLRIRNPRHEQDAQGSVTGTYAEGVVGAQSESWLGVPIMSATEPIGVVVFGDVRPNAFTDADERLVATVASSLGVALENVRLFAETKRLLGETEQRNAELAVVNEIGGGARATARLPGCHRPGR